MILRSQNSKHLPVATMLFYLYFLFIASFHFHHINLEYFTGSIYSSADNFHDFYEKDNFCKLNSTSSSLFFSSGEEAWGFYDSSDNTNLEYISVISTIRIGTGCHLRAPPIL